MSKFVSAFMDFEFINKINNPKTDFDTMKNLAINTISNSDKFGKKAKLIHINKILRTKNREDLLFLIYSYIQVSEGRKI